MLNEKKIMKKKILIVIPSNKGTIALCSLNLYLALLKIKDIDVKAVIVHKIPNGLEEFEGCEWFMDHVSSGMQRLGVAIRQTVWLRKIKKEFVPDITISTLFSCSTISVLSGGKDFKIGIFHSPHQQVKAAGKLAYLSTLLIYSFIYPFLNRLCCVSSEVKRSILDSFPTIPKKKVEVVYNIHNTDRLFSLANEPLSDEEHAVFENPVVLYCGRLDKNKAPERLLMAFGESDLLKKSYHLVYIGVDTDSLWNRLEAEAHQMDVIENVHYWGAQKNPYKYMSRAKVLVSCSFSEGLPGVLIESLFLNVPVISTNSSEGVWEILNCADCYDSQLQSYHITDNGVITSNTGNPKIDIPNLKWALEYIDSMEYENVPFNFGNKVLPENVIYKLIG